MSFKTSGTYARPTSDGGGPPLAQNGTQVFPMPPRPSENARRPVAPATPEVSVRATLGVGEAPATPVPARPARRTPRDANEPTRIFVMPNAADADANDGRASGEVSRRTATFASPPFSPVPNAKVVARAMAKPTAAAPRPAAPRLTPKAPGPLLRAFDDARERVTTWSTAKTITATLPPTAEAEARAAASEAMSATANARTPPPGEPIVRSSSLQQLIASLKLSSPTRKIMLVVLAMTVVVSSGSFVGRSIAKKGVIPGRVSAAIAASPKAAKPAAPGSVAATLPVATALAVATAKPVATDPVATEPVAPAERATPTEPVASVSPPTPAALAPIPRSSAAAAATLPGSSDVTLARQAVDALIAGDRLKALSLYRELSRRSPDRDAYREAVRLLSAATPGTDP